MLPASSDVEPSASPAFAATSASPRCRQRPGRCSDRAGACACGGWVQWQADSGRTGEAGCCAADVEGSIGAAEAAEAACPTAQSGARCACVPCASVHSSGGRELRRVRVASRRVGLVDVLWHDFHQSPSRRPEQREQPQWPSRRHLCGGDATTAAETARWRRVGTRVDWSCSRRCLRSNLCTLGSSLCWGCAVRSRCRRCSHWQQVVRWCDGRGGDGGAAGCGRRCCRTGCCIGPRGRGSLCLAPPPGSGQLLVRSFPPPFRHLQSASGLEAQMCR